MVNVKSVHKKGKETPLYLLLDHATAQAVSRQPLTAEARIQSQASS
jgi:hypothetical protein